MLASINGCVAEYLWLGVLEKPIGDGIQFFVRIIMNDYLAALLGLPQVYFSAQGALKSLGQVRHMRVDYFDP